MTCQSLCYIKKIENIWTNKNCDKNMAWIGWSVKQSATKKEKSVCENAMSRVRHAAKPVALESKNSACEEVASM